MIAACCGDTPRLGSQPSEIPSDEELLDFRPSVHSLLSRAEGSYLAVFWNERAGFLFNVVSHDFSLKDTMESEAAITAAAMLGESVFSRQQLMRIWQRAADTLLVHQHSCDGPMAFGVLATNANRRIFYGDREYHCDVVWPRSTPYLLRLLELLGQKDVIKQVLISNLDHQTTEGAAFYNHELFSRPCGNNSAPDLPLLEIFDGWLRDGIDARLTLSLSPCLLEMLADPLPPVGLSGLPRGEFRQPVMCSLNMIENCKSCCSLCRMYARVSRRPVGMLLGSVFLLLVGGGPFST